MSIGVFFPMYQPSAPSAGEIIINATGAWSFVVPKFKTFLSVELWGAGGGGRIRNGSDPSTGGNTTCTTLGMTAGGGQVGSSTGGVGSASTASGGTINTNGQVGGGISNGKGGDSPNGGAGGIAPTSAGSGRDGQQPGGGGSAGKAGTWPPHVGGGGGAYCFKQFTPAALAKDTIIIGVVGAGGNGGVVGGDRGGKGGDGRVRIIWG